VSAASQSHDCIQLLVSLPGWNLSPQLVPLSNADHPHSSHLHTAQELLGRALHAIHTVIIYLFIYLFFTFTPNISISNSPDSLA